MKIKFDKAPVSSLHNNGVAVPYGPAKRNVARWRWYLLLSMVLALPLFLLAQFLLGTFWQSVPGVVVAEYSVIRAGVSGRIATVTEAGAHVQAGEPLLSLLPDAANTTVELVAGRGGALANSTSQAPLPPGADTRGSALRSVVTLAQQQASMAQSRLAEIRALRTQQAATQQEVATAQSASLAAQTALARAQEELGEARRQYLKDVAAARMVVPPTTPTSDGVSTALPPPGTVDLAVRSPFEGTVVRSLVLPQEWVVPSTEVAVLQGTQAPTIQAFVAPEEMRYAQTGRTATLRFLDGGSAKATVVGVVAEAGKSPELRGASLVPREPSVVVRLQADQPLPERYRIHHLPLKVSFDRSWKDGVGA